MISPMLNNDLCVYIYAILQTIYSFLIYEPLKDLYLRGPCFNGIFGIFGFWSGKNQEDICAELTNVNASFWQVQAEACGELIAKRVDAFILGIFWMLFIFLIVKISNMIWYKYFIIEPILSKIECFLQKEIVNYEEKNLRKKTGSN